MRKKLLLPFVVLLMLACALPVSPSFSQSAPTLPPGALETMIVQTAGAAQTMTSAVQPTITSTITNTVTPSITMTPTVTFIYKLYTDTPIPSETPTIFFTVESRGGGGGGDEEATPKPKPIFTGRDWTCAQVGVFPPKNSEFKVRSKFLVEWQLMNTGTKSWGYNDVDFVWFGGYRHDDTKIQDLAASIPTGGKIRVVAHFTAPKSPGEFQTIFHLMVGKRDFCFVNYQFFIVN